MHSELLPVMNDGAGNHFCLDCGKLKDGVCPVVLWEHDNPKEEKQRPSKVSASFAKWIVTLAQE